jgi:uncharacterized membrane protein
VNEQPEETGTPDAVWERDREADRFLTFIDAIVAIAITLLVLPLVDLTSKVHQYATVGELLRHNQSQIWACLLSFFVVSRFWFVQRGVARHLRQYHHRVAWLLMLWVLTIVLLPFPTALVAEAADSSVTKAFYLGTMVATTLLMTAVMWLMRRHPEITDDDPAGDLDPVDGLANALLLALALAISLTIPATGYYPLLLLNGAGLVADGWRRLR